MYLKTTTVNENDIIFQQLLLKMVSNLPLFSFDIIVVINFKNFAFHMYIWGLPPL